MPYLSVSNVVREKSNQSMALAAIVLDTLLRETQHTELHSWFPMPQPSTLEEYEDLTYKLSIPGMK